MIEGAARKRSDRRLGACENKSGGRQFDVEIDGPDFRVEVAAETERAAIPVVNRRRGCSG
jgi:hypothetical protein